MNILTGNVSIKRIWQLLEKTLTPADLPNYSIPIDSQSDSDTKRIPLDELRVALLNTGLFDYRGDYDASVNLYPSSGGSGTGGAILKANAWIVSVGGTIDGNAVIPGQILMAKVDNPGQTSANWFISLAGGSSSDIYTPSTQPVISTGTMTLDCESTTKNNAMFEGRTSVGTLTITDDFTIAFANLGSVKLISLILTLTGTNEITFPNTVMCSNPSSKGTWASNVLTLASGTGVIVEFQLIWYSSASKWQLKVSEEGVV